MTYSSQSDRCSASSPLLSGLPISSGTTHRPSHPMAQEPNFRRRPELTPCNNRQHDMARERPSMK